MYHLDAPAALFRALRPEVENWLTDHCDRERGDEAQWFVSSSDGASNTVRITFYDLGLAKAFREKWLTSV
jgi:hypothetical protein